MRYVFTRDESGIAMPLAVIIVLLIGVMGAGLLTFVSTDLNSVVENNRGQKAFEMADAGVKAAEHQLQRETTANKYDGTGSVGANTESQWSWNATNTSCGNPSGHGVCLSDLDPGPTMNRVNVTIDSRPGSDTFKVVSTGEYGVAKRRVEAYFKKKPGHGGMPAYYTPGDIIFSEPTGTFLDHAVEMKGLSFFAGGNIMFEHLANYTNAELNAHSGGSYSKAGVTPRSKINITNVADSWLGDWNTADNTYPAYASSATPTYWNTTGRKGSDNSTPYTRSGFAAEGYVCKGLDVANCDSPEDSIADGVQAYDSTTGTGGNKGIYKFVEKIPPEKNPNVSGTITYPFPVLTPDADHLEDLAKQPGGEYRTSAPSSNADWQAIYPASRDYYQTVFIDLEGAANKDVVLGGGGTNDFMGVNTADHYANRTYGVLVVRCGNLTLKDHFKGIIIILKGTGAGCENTGYFKNRGYDEHIDSFVYAEGGIEIVDCTHMKPIPDALVIDKDGINDPNYARTLFDLAYGGTASAGMDLISWREVYE